MGQNKVTRDSNAHDEDLWGDKNARKTAKPRETGGNLTRGLVRETDA